MQYRTSNVAENFGYAPYLHRTYITGENFELTLTVKMVTRHPIEGPFGSKSPAICNHCGVMMAWSRKIWKILWTIFAFFKLSLLRRSRPTSESAIRTKLAYSVPDLIQIGSLSAELLPNAWWPFLLCRVFPI